MAKMSIREKREVSEEASPFFRILPGELRNLIYRHTLLDPDPIKITKNAKLPQPGILQTSKQCRKEAGDIYYQENTFAFGISHFDAGIYISWCKTSPQRRWCRTNAFVSRSQNWANLLIWLKAYWDKECGGIVGSEEGKFNADAKAATHLFSMTKKMREHGLLTWEDAEGFLEEAHKALAGIRPRWSWRSGSADMVANLG
ncbi:hypothetical protein LTR62_007373 [Meristemomyces frigidus]|uniref:Uncharacterized protein n=1 Tax=Meristemomyces frigidus TaxID=1508187 RepID=A0AAN7TV26_9PEZI|nr:hypothetical protein LTR62_007373 [Meristemomyces frigidus]